ncbi:MAG: protein kinase [Anaerolineae bacterium]|nr:protein kinase [Anaerolineae bacterium]
MEPQRFAEFDLIETIGQGGMATVYKAFQPSVGRYVAIKVLPRQYSEDPAFTKRFQREARMIARLEHRSVLPVYAYGEFEGQPYIVMRLLESGSLRKRLFQGPLDLPTIARMLEQIAEGLDYAHQQGIVHRDIKPSNILLDERDNAYLTDFGIAKMLGTTTHVTTEGVVGTPHYMSPERCRGKSATPASDIYSLGAILFELVTGQPPFDADTPLTVMYMHVREPIPSVTEIEATLPAAIDDVIARAMAKEPEDRYPTAVDLAASFKEAVAGSIRTEPPPPPPAPPTRKEVSRPGLLAQPGLKPHSMRWLSSIALPIIVFALIVLGFIFWPQIGEWLQGGPPATSDSTAPPDSESTPVVPTVESASDVELPTRTPESPSTAAPEPTSDGLSFNIDVTPGPQTGPGRLAFFTLGESAESEIVLIDAEGSNRQVLTDNQVYDGEPDWSPDGQYLAFESMQAGNSDIYIALVVNGSLASGDIQQLTSGTEPDRHPDWSPDGTSIAYESGSGNRSEIVVVQVDGGMLNRLTSNDTADRAPQFSPDGTQIAFMTNQRGVWEIALMDYPGGQVTEIFDCPAADCRFPAWSPDGRFLAYNTLSEDGEAESIYALDIATGRSMPLVEEGENGRPAWSGDGLSLYFNRTEDDTTDLYRLDLQSRAVTRLTETESNDYAPDWTGEHNP